MKKQKTILVTGGAGFIGSNLIAKLVQNKNNRVISLDNYFTGLKENHVQGAEYREGHTKDIEKYISETPDIIYHLGEYSRVAASLNEPELVWDLNIRGTQEVLEFWRKKKCKLIYAGSSTKFAKGRSGVKGRDISPYTWAKAANSELVRNYARWYGLDYAITYFFCVYGPGERAGQFNGGYGTVVETFKQFYLNNQPCEVRKPGTQTRAFTHVDDTINGILLVGERGRGDNYGICSKDVYSLLDLAKMFGCKIKMLPATKTSRSNGAFNVDKIKKLGWKQIRTLKQYIESIKINKK